MNLKKQKVYWNTKWQNKQREELFASRFTKLVMILVGSNIQLDGAVGAFHFQRQITFHPFRVGIKEAVDPSPIAFAAEVF